MKEYRRLLFQFMVFRNAADSASDIEATAELDKLWDQMTVAEQEETERWFQGEGLNAREDLGLVDVVVVPGDKQLPRMEKV